MNKFTIFFSVFSFLMANMSFSQLSLNWVKNHGGIDNENLQSMVVDKMGNVITTGTFLSTNMNIDSSAENLFLTGLLTSFLLKNDQNGNTLWALSINSSSYSTSAYKVDVDDSSNIYVSGGFVGTCDFNSLTTTDTSISSTQNNGFLAKYDPLGNLKWVIKLAEGTSFSISVEDIHVDKNNNIIISMSHTGVIDIDPSLNVISITDVPIPIVDYTIQKFDSNGSLIDYMILLPEYECRISSITTDEELNVYLHGYFSSTFDLDPSASSFFLTSMGLRDIFIGKYDQDFNFIWARGMGGVNQDSDGMLLIDNDTNLVLISGPVGSMDADPGTGTTVIGGTTSVNFIGKYSKNGDFIYAFDFDDQYDSSPVICLDASNNIYVTASFGSFLDSVDVDPGTGSYYLHKSTGISSDIFISKLNTSGNFLWSISLGGNASDIPKSILINDSSNVLISGVFSGIGEFAPGFITYNVPNYGNSDAFVLNLKQDSCTNFGLFIDSLNGIDCQDTIGVVVASCVGGNPPYNYYWESSYIFPDSILQFNSPGIYKITAYDAGGCFRKNTLVLNGSSYFSDFDLNINLISTPMISGFLSKIYLDGFNSGCLSITGYFGIVLDSNVEFINASISPTTINGDTLIWNFYNQTYDSIHYINCINIITDTVISIGDSVCFTIIANPIVGDIDTTNNIKTYCFPVVASYDPNDKQVYPQGVNANHGILNDQKMTYTVRFQNTGTADAINIYILDSLDSHLDLNTVNVISSSHYMFTEVLPGNVLKFRFPNIYLPDSTSDEPNSHGYVIFEVDQLPNLPHNTLIENTVDIYFDYNEPVRTNTVFNTIDLGSKIIASTNTLCLGDSATLTAVPNVPGLPANWQWLTSSCSGVLIATGNTLNISPTSSTAYYLYDSLNGMCYDTLININLVNTSVSTSGITLTANASPATYQWLDCDAAMASIAGETNQDFTAILNGNYAVVVTENGCTDTSACVAVTTVGFNSGNGLFTVDVFPNPVNNAFTIRLSKAISNATISLQNPAGQLVYNKNHTSVKSDVITTENLSSGIYYLTISTQEFSQRIKLSKL